ncbi:hypothetical protein [Methylococcus capsulatus]|uniref:hypothetical protein n=1 Tax=Methylococcus capsulatus TaxID=414 RepID=UPI001C5286A5|nr:hypothetical protein [Methylococcus capsulatus]QXP87248.1 hypothetical protein KW112_12860 [Methylococcus capsulatus]QXP93073.1 hypothetical protein KW113_11975 [Methylococcus capsulatus]
MRPLSASVLAFVMSAPCAIAQAAPLTWNLYDAYTQSFTVPYAAPVPFGSAGMPAELRMNATIGGNTLTFQLDTGSRGIAVSRDLLPPDFPTKGRPGHIFYWSSGNRLNGRWIETRITFPDALDGQTGAALPAQATLPILVVETETCVAAPAGEIFPNHCTDPGVTKPSTHTTMMGIGFDRTGHGDTPNNDRWNQQFNPFLNLDAMRSGSMRAGYILTPQGVQLGLTAANTANAGQAGVSVSDFAFQKLIPTGLEQVPGSPPDWQAPTGSVTLNGTAYPLGQAVLDTGIDDMLLSLPAHPSSGNLTAATLEVSLLDSKGAVGYGFSVSDAQDPVTPATVTWSPLQSGRWSENWMSGAFVNTGVRALNAFNFLYDGTGGYVGLQLNGAAAGVSARLSPQISAQGQLPFPNGFNTNLPVVLQGKTEISVPGKPPGAVVFNGPVSGSGGLIVKKGKVVLACDASYTGTTVVDSGAILVYSRLAGKLKRRPGGVVIQEPDPSGTNCPAGTDTLPGWAQTAGDT